MLFFGRLGDAAGSAETMVEFPHDEMDVEVFRSLVARSNLELANELGKTSVRAVINSEMVLPGAIVRDGDVVAFLPPVSGG